MSRWIGATLGLVVFCASCSLHTNDKEKDAQAVIDKAAKAMGGAEKLASAELVTYKVKLKSAPGGRADEMTFQIIEASGGRERSEMERDPGNGEIIKSLTVLNGEKVWRKQGEEIRQLDQEVALHMKRTREMFDAVRLPLILKDPGFHVKLAGEEKIGGKTAVVLDVIGTSGQEFRLSFDKESGLPIRLEATSTVHGERETAVTTFFTGYKEFDGIQVATRRLQARNNVNTSESEIIEFKVLEKVPPGSFDEPT
jgi:hypothetical protein